DGYRVTGRKVWVANADAAAVAIVFAATRPGLRGQGVTAFLVPMDTPGIVRTGRDDSLGVRGLGCMDLEFDMAVAADQVLGPVDSEARRVRSGAQGRRQSDADPRICRLPPWLARRAPVSRRASDRDLPGNVGGATHDHRRQGSCDSLKESSTENYMPISCLAI